MSKEVQNKYYDINNDRSDIAILGGSFNPIHNGHMLMAEEVYNEYGLRVVLMPNSTTYYKNNDSRISDADRMIMVKLAASKADYLYYSDMEIIRGGITHTIDTVRELYDICPDRTIYFIIGGDSLEWIDKWVEASEILKRVHILTAVRGNTGIIKSTQIIERLLKEYPDSRIDLLKMKNVDISSSDIRERIASGKSIEGMLPDTVKDYIAERGLYR